MGYLPAFGVPEENFELDLTIARGLDYYTGTVYETVLLDHPEVATTTSRGTIRTSPCPASASPSA